MNKIIKAGIIMLFTISIFSSSVLYAEAQHVVEGTVFDQQTGEPLVSATILLQGINRAAVTNRKGFFSLKNIPAGEHIIRVSYISHRTEQKTISVPDDTSEPLRFVLEEQPFEFDDLIVTASPLQSTIQYQPAQAFNAEQLQRRSSSSLGELLDGEPGISMRYFGPATARPVIRGFDGERILVLQNGERMGDLAETSADHGTAIEPLSANRVEVVRGPATLLYGTNALGGVVNILSEDIPRFWAPGLSGNAALQGISMNAAGAGLADITYGLDDWAFSGRFSYRNAGNVRTPEGRIPNTYLENLTAGIGIGFDKGNVKGGASFNYLDQTYGIPEKLDDPDEEVEIQTTRENIQGFLEWNKDGFIRSIEWRFSGSQFSLKEFEFEFEDGEIDDIELGLDFLQHNLSSTVTFMHNPFSIFSEGAFGINTNFRFLQVGGDEAFTPNGRSKFIALFAFEEVPLSSKLKIQTGSRLEYQNIEERSNELFPDAGSTRNNVTFSGSVGLNFTPFRDLEFGSQFVRAQRLPGFEELFANGPHVALGTFDIGNPNLNNEISHGMDTFVRFKTDVLFAEISVFYNRVSDFIFRQPTGEVDPGSNFPVVELQQENAVLYGSEIIVRYTPTSRLQFDGSLDYVKGSGMNGEVIPLPFMPPLSSKLGVRYQTHDWWIGGNIRVTNSQNRVAPGELETEGYKLVNLETGYRFGFNGKHILTFRIDNLFNVTYRDHLSRIEDRDIPMPARSAVATYRWIF